MLYSRRFRRKPGNSEFVVKPFVVLRAQMPSDEKLQETIDKLFAQIAIPENEIDGLFQKAVDAGYWKSLCPDMGLMDQQPPDYLEGATLSLEQETWALADFARYGYFQLPSIISPGVIDRMHSSVESLRSANWPAVFSFVYDEFWAILRTPSVVRLLSRLLGAGYLQTAPIWTYRVDPRTRSSGWPPHADSRKDDRLTVWIPLTDATIDNGCMYVIPRNCLPPELSSHYADWTSVSHKNLGILLHNVTPLPAAPGSILGWNHSLIHWGGRATKSSTPPRISLGVEFLRKGEKPSASELPVFDTNVPGLPGRLRVIGQAMRDYEKFEPRIRRYRDLAIRLMELDQ